MQIQAKQKIYYGSQAPTQAEELTALNISPVPTKPKDDPDAPPALELQNNGEFVLGESDFFEDDTFIKQKCKEKRLRTRSEDNQYSIIGFLEKKIRVRIMSEELTDKVSTFDINQ